MVTYVKFYSYCKKLTLTHKPLKIRLGFQTIVMGSTILHVEMEQSI